MLRSNPAAGACSPKKYTTSLTFSFSVANTSPGTEGPWTCHYADWERKDALALQRSPPAACFVLTHRPVVCIFPLASLHQSPSAARTSNYSEFLTPLASCKAVPKFLMPCCRCRNGSSALPSQEPVLPNFDYPHFSGFSDDLKTWFWKLSVPKVLFLMPGKKKIHIKEERVYGSWQ